VYENRKNPPDLAFQLVFDRSKFLEALSDGNRDVIFTPFFNFWCDARDHARASGRAAYF
jgi:hypothetical protein